MFSILCCYVIIILFKYEINHSFSSNKIIKLLSKLGKISFTLYVIHSPLLALTTSELNKNLIGENKYMMVICIVAICLIGTLISFKLIEQPSQKYAEKLGVKNVSA
jgi:peptidoglycan/LPS O-acetylase OafA/YrhL